MPTRKPKLANNGNHGLFGAITWGYGLGDNWKQLNGTEYRALILANRYSWPVADFHANGDGESELALEAMDLANKERPLAGRRFGFVHGVMRPMDQLQRLAKYDAVLSFRPNYLFYDAEAVQRMKKLYGADALNGFTPAEDVIRAGMKPIIENDNTYRALPKSRGAGRGTDNIATVPEDKISEIPILQTVVGGKVVHEAGK